MINKLTNLLLAIALTLVAGAIAFAVIVPTVGIGVQAGADDWTVNNGLGN